jgi:hypothetical protein
MAAAKTIKKVVVELPEVSPKNKVVRFDRDKDKFPAPQNLYVANELVSKIGGAPKGVRVTIEAL